MRAPLTARIEASEPVTGRIPEGWFWMGCELGRDDEKPEHRVWVDAFDLAVHQVTNEEYACFLAAMRDPVPRAGTIHVSMIRRCLSSPYRGTRL